MYPSLTITKCVKQHIIPNSTKYNYCHRWSIRSGKTTICNLISRFYDVNEGSIKIGNVDIREMTCDSLLKNISMVFQNVYLFHDAILNNIKFGSQKLASMKL